MLYIHIPEIEFYDSVTEEFGYFKAQDIALEHSLLSIAKWEAKWHKPYLSEEDKTPEEAIDYIRCMTLTQNVNPEIYNYLNQDIVNQIVAYIEDPMTATWFGSRKTKGPSRPIRRNREIMTAEVIYYYMIQLQIPFECQKWHLNRLLTLIRVCSEKNNPKQMGRQDLLAQQRLLNAQRRARLNTKG